MRLLDQHKHHRWCLDSSQINQYQLGFALHPGRRWWEDIAVQPRQLLFVTANDWLTLCPLVCEDLARVEPISKVIRNVGPTLLVALLQDGPQLGSRWPARYATVLAEDPGSSVLTLTSLGMCARSVGGGDEPSRTVALWKDRRRVRELALADGADGMILSICANGGRNGLLTAVRMAAAPPTCCTLGLIR